MTTIIITGLFVVFYCYYATEIMILSISGGACVD